ncbi:delta-adaptin,adaptor complex protein AP-3 delta [Trypanosoma cruzi cruzi]|nr:delta-adaptin,adaptor complex protein AP-3 delta [Trypanosoma cruzi cruzi]PWU93453.1 putative delta-adaptin [Trypanosoma cruzi]
MAEATRVASQILFQNSLAEVVRKLRSAKKSEAEVIEQCIAETRKEITSTVQSVKVTAVLKAVYFSMLGYSAAYGAFNIIEVMADRSFAHKRIGYMAACITFTPKTDVLPLLTALLKRDLASANQYEVGFALYCISSICTKDIARDLVVDVVNLLNHPRNYVRKKAVLSLYRIFFEYPEALRPTYPRLKEKLDDHSERCDNDPAVRGAVVCILCELARRNPANFLGLAVPFFSMLSTVHSNWTLIKIVKVFGYFAPHEPRLGKKLVEPIANLICATGAKSVQYECILSVANGMSKVPSLTKLAAEKIKLFVEDADQNLKYLGLDAMSRMMRENPKLLIDQREVVLACLNDTDATIRRKALEILQGIVTKKNIVSTINSMMERRVRSPPDEEWSNRVIATVIEVAQTDDYTLLQDFEWYFSILLDISLVNLTAYQHGALVQRELVTVLTRVNAVRQFGVQAVSELLCNSTLLNCDATRSTQWQIIKAAAFLCGEYPYWLLDKRLTCERLLSDRIATMHPEAQVACVAAVGKIAAFVHQPCPRHVTLSHGEEELKLPDDPVTDAELRAVILPQQDSEKEKDDGDDDKGKEEYSGLELFRHSIYPDVQERAHLVFYHVDTNPDIGPTFYLEELLSVAVGAQDAVKPPDDLDLGEPFCTHLPPLLQPSDSDDDENMDGDEDEFDFLGGDAVELQRRKEEERRGEVAAFYIKDTTLTREELPVDVRLEKVTAASLHLHGTGLHVPRKTHSINRELLRPSNYVAANPARRRNEEVEEDEATKKFRNVDVTRALTADEKLPEPIPYTQSLQLRASVGTGKEGARAAAAAAEAAVFDPVVLLEERHLHVTANVVSCHVHKECTLLTLEVEVSNLASSSSAYDVQLCIKYDEDNFTEQSVQLESLDLSDTNNSNSNNVHKNDDKKKKRENIDDSNQQQQQKKKGEEKEEEEEKGNGGSGVTGVCLAERIKGSKSVCRKIGIRFISQLPPSFVKPLTFILAYTRGKKQAATTLQLPLFYPYFSKIPKDVPPAEFSQNILGKFLLTAPMVSGFVDVNLTHVPLAMPLIQQKLRLKPVEIFKDVASFHGVLHARKSTAEKAHVAVLLREDTVEGDKKGITIMVKAHQTCLAESLVQEIASLMIQEAF